MLMILYYSTENDTIHESEKSAKVFDKIAKDTKEFQKQQIVNYIDDLRKSYQSEIKAVRDNYLVKLEDAFRALRDIS